jgi:hypothetical protein
LIVKDRFLIFKSPMYDQLFENAKLVWIVVSKNEQILARVAYHYMHKGKSLFVIL